ncbi:MAG: flagellar biosynthesis protein FliQ [Spongiibacteraceae bacterium]|jgi:flagellar biosynthetic protein FliQ|nr:flagellar biosynthesis protein FliQ [Spongiibacteraceae bacterium]
MSPEVVIDLFAQALLLVIMMVCVLVVPGLLVGLVIATFQAATQINEQTLSFLPRLVVTLVALMIAGPWLLTRITDFTRTLIMELPRFIG